MIDARPPATPADGLDVHLDVLITALESILRATPEGLSEHALIRRLQAAPWSLLGEVDYSSPAALYPIHFLLFHGLYRLDLELRHQGTQEVLHISAMRIHLYRSSELVPLTGPNATELAPPDPLAQFYLDLENYYMDREDVDRLVQRFFNGPCDIAPEQLTDALCILELDALPGTYADAKRQFRRLAMRDHPDRGGTDAQVQRLNLAIGVLRKHFEWQRR